MLGSYKKHSHGLYFASFSFVGWHSLAGKGKNNLFHFLCIILLVLSANGVFAQCSPHKIARHYKANLKPYKYDSYNYNEVTFGDKPQTIEVIFTAFANIKYKLVFGTSMFDENVKVDIFDKSMHTHKRKKLFDNGTGVDNLFWSVEISTPGIYYINYEVPAKGDSKSPDGCMVLLIGYQEK
jgi:hypothetical protein